MNPRDEHNSPFRHREPIPFKSWRKFWGIFLNKWLTFLFTMQWICQHVFEGVMNLRSSEFCEEKNQSEEEIYLTSTLKETVGIWSTRGRAYSNGENWSSSLCQLAYFFIRTLDHFPQSRRHEICPKFYTAGFSGQKFYTLIFTEFQQFLVIKTPKNE